jgi:hypothetical protein
LPPKPAEQKILSKPSWDNSLAALSAKAPTSAEPEQAKTSLLEPEQAVLS